MSIIMLDHANDCLAAITGERSLCNCNPRCDCEHTKQYHTAFHGCYGRTRAGEVCDCTRFKLKDSTEGDSWPL